MAYIGAKPINEKNGGTNQTTYATGDLLYASTTNTLSKLAISAEVGSPFTTDGSVPLWADPLKYLIYIDDFICGGTNTTANALFGAPWVSIELNGGTINQANTTSAHPGVMALNTTTTTNGAAGFKMGINNTGGNNCMAFGGGTFDMLWLMNLSALSTGTDTYTVRIGFGNVSNTGLSSDCAYFEYVDAGAQPNWQIITRAATVQTKVDSGIAASATGYHKFRITVNTAGTSVGFFIDGVQATGSPIVTNIPTAAVSPYVVIIKSAGTTAATMNIDLFKLYHVLTSSR